MDLNGIQETKDGLLVKIRVTPKASKSRILGWKEGELRIAIAAPPTEGKANQTLIRFLADLLEISTSRICLIKGEANRSKQLLLENYSTEKLFKKLFK